MDNNALCGAQGAILIFSSLATVLWCAALIVNLHMHTVWNSSFFANKYIFLHVFCWGVPAAFMAAALGLHAVKFEFANLCLVSIDYIFDLFFYPMAAIIAPAFLLHILTFFYIAKVCRIDGVKAIYTHKIGWHPTLSSGGYEGERTIWSITITLCQFICQQKPACYKET